MVFSVIWFCKYLVVWSFFRSSGFLFIRSSRFDLMYQLGLGSPLYFFCQSRLTRHKSLKKPQKYDQLSAKNFRNFEQASSTNSFKAQKIGNSFQPNMIFFCMFVLPHLPSPESQGFSSICSKLTLQVPPHLGRLPDIVSSIHRVLLYSK